MDVVIAENWRDNGEEQIRVQVVSGSAFESVMHRVMSLYEEAIEAVISERQLNPSDKTINEGATNNGVWESTPDSSPFNLDWRTGYIEWRFFDGNEYHRIRVYGPNNIQQPIVTFTRIEANEVKRLAS
jgi:hypothetical protein